MPLRMSTFSGAFSLSTHIENFLDKIVTAVAIMAVMWTTSLPSKPWPVVSAETNTQSVAIAFPPLPKVKPPKPWPAPPPPAPPALTQSENQPTITSKRTILAGEYERVISAIYVEIGSDYKANMAETDPFEKLHFLPVSVELLTRLFDCIDVRNIPQANAYDESSTDTED